jgi:hypothetical protein
MQAKLIKKKTVQEREKIQFDTIKERLELKKNPAELLQGK